MRVFLKYLLLQGAEWKIFCSIPYVRHAYENKSKSGTDALIGGKGVAHEAIVPAGYIRIHGELWKTRTEGESIVPDVW